MLSKIKLIVILPLALSLYACGGAKNVLMYKNTTNNNLVVKLNNQGKMPGIGMTSSIDVYSLDNNCKSGNKGRVILEQGNNRIGLESGKFVKLVFNINEDSSIYKSSIQEPILFKVNKKYKYTLEIDYIDSMLDIRLFKNTGRKSTRIKIYKRC